MFVGGGGAYPFLPPCSSNMCCPFSIYPALVIQPFRDIFVVLTELNFELHYEENLIYVFLLWELRGVSMSNLYIPRIGPHISLQLCRLRMTIYWTLPSASTK